MPPKKNVNKTREPVTSTTKSLGTRVGKKNTRSGKNSEVPITNIDNHEDASGINDESQKKIQEDIHLLSKKDINIMLANEVLKTQFPSKMPILDAIEHAIVDEIEMPKNIFKKNKKGPINQKTTVKTKIIKKSVALKIRKKKKVLDKSCSSNQETCSNTTEQEDNNEQVPKVSPVKIKPGRKLNLKKKVQTNKLQVDKPKFNKKYEPRPEPEKKVQQRGRPKKKTIEKISSVEEKKTETPKEIMKSPLPVKRRKIIPNDISRSSSFSDLSWTRDISSCSTSCVSVSSNDFVVIDNKLPVIKLKNINPKPGPKSFKNGLRRKIQNPSEFKEFKENKTVDEELFKLKENEELLENNESEVPYGALVPPVLSSSSSSSDSSSSSSFTENTSCVSNKDNNIINDLFAKLRGIDLEVIAWVGFNNTSCSTPKHDQFKDKLDNCSVLREEINFLERYSSGQKQPCKRTINHDSDIISPTSKAKQQESTNSSRDTFLKPTSVSQTVYRNRVLQVQNIPDKPAQSTDTSAVQSASSNGSVMTAATGANTKTQCNANNSSSKYQDDNDDDDALSLYAESITGLDSSRRSSSIQRVPDPHRNDEYIPEFLTKTSRIPVTFYKPSRIEITHETEQAEEQQESHVESNVAPAVCEKQNADSTSLNKEQENDKSTPEETVMFEDRRGIVEKPNFNANLYNASKPLYPNHTRLMAQNYKFPRGSRSAVFNFCYFNLENRCLNSNCKFTHIIPRREEIERKVSALDEESFIAEFMLAVWSSPLRRMYGICFVDDCIRRKLTRLLVEMLINFNARGDYNNSEDNALKADAVERGLLYLNDVDLNVYRDLLNYKFKKFKGLLLCDYLLKFVAESPNFTRFIPIFVKLAWYKSGMDLRFDVQVAALLLERVCILPYEDKLARALIEVIKNTNDSIFYNHMIEKFENMLATSNKDLYNSFVFLKKRKILNQTVAENRNGGMYFENDVRYSPDTTNLDNLNKTMEPKFTRTIENKVSSQNATELPKNLFQEDWHLPSSSRGGEQTVFGLTGQYQSNAPPFPKALDLQSGYKRFLDTPFVGNRPNKIRRTIHTDHHFQRGNSMMSNSSSGSEGGHSMRRGSPYRGKRGMFMRRDNAQFRNVRQSDGPRFF